VVAAPDSPPAFLELELAPDEESIRTLDPAIGGGARRQTAPVLEDLGQLVGGIAHDFNNLLAFILNYRGFVDDDLAKATRGDWLEHVESARVELLPS